jgi:hypothetical protein
VGNASVDVSTRFTMVSRVQSTADPKARGRINKKIYQVLQPWSSA